MTVEPTIRRVPLRTLWIKGIRTAWQLRKPLLAIWALTIVLPIIGVECWLAPQADQVVAQIRSVADSASGAKIPVITQVIGLTTPFVMVLFTGYLGIFLVAALGWIAILFVVHRYFEGFPPFPPTRLIGLSLKKLILGNYLAIGFGTIFGFAGMVGFPILDLLSAIILMIPAYQIATGKSFFRSASEALRLRYAGHFRGGRFLSVLQLAMMSIVVSTGIIGFIHGFEWILNETANWSAVRGMSPEQVPVLNQVIVVARNCLIGLLIFLLPTYQMTLYFWLYSIPRMLHEKTLV